MSYLYPLSVDVAVTTPRTAGARTSRLVNCDVYSNRYDNMTTFLTS